METLMRPVRRLTLSLRHLLIALTAMGLLPLAVIGVWSIHAAAEHRQIEQERALLDLAHALSSAVDAELDGSVATLSSMARAPSMAAGDIRAFYDSAHDQVQAQSDWLGVVLTDGEGRQLFRTMVPYGAPLPPVVDPDSLRQALAVRHPVVGRIRLGADGHPALPVRVPVTDRRGNLYVLSAAIRPDRIVRVVARQRIPQNSVISVLDAAGDVVARSDGRQIAVAAQPSLSLRELMRGGPEDVGRTTGPDGREMLTAYTTLSRYGWTVAVAAPRGSAFLQGFTAYGAGAAVSIALCIVLASLLSARILRTLAGLQRAAAALGAGQPVEVAPSQLEEVRELGLALVRAARQRDDHERERSLLMASLKDALVQARAADGAKDAFLAVLGHELRNPLAPIVASLDLMDLRDESSARRERTIMRRQVNHLRRLVDDLLDISRIATGKLRIELQAVDLAEVVRQTVAALPGQSVTAHTPPHTWVHGDESRLTQVLSNLLSNAARFGSSATSVTLTAEGSSARLVVVDNGVGMAPETAARVFEPFYQAPQPLARHTGGLGLGLAIVRKIVELHGGGVAAHSDGEGRGSRFEIVLPLGQPAGPDTAPAATVNPERLRVLVVDDNQDAAASNAALLNWLGHETRVAHTAAHGLALAAQTAPDLAILDIGLPDMDGYALAAALRTRSPGIRLVALTGYGQKSDIERAARAGFDVHLTKPATVDDLRRALAQGRAVAAT
jgi:signal transduction histidine kinase/CheY-like chemotaxis protein